MFAKLFENICFRVVFSFLLLISLEISTVQSAKILAVFPFPGPSQYITVETYLKALAARGHELTVISHFPQKEKLPNFHDITLKYESYDNKTRLLLRQDMGKERAFSRSFFVEITARALGNPQVQELLFEKKVNFDLVIVEMCKLEALYALAPHLNAHLMGISSYGTDAVVDKWTGNPSPLSYAPITTLGYTDHMNFWQRLDNFVQATLYYFYMEFSHFENQKVLFRKYFPHLKYDLNDICKNFSLILLNQHFSLSFPRPYVPNLIEVGGLFLKHESTPLPEDIQTFLDDAEYGAVYFSMGSNVKSIFFSEEKRNAIIKVLGSLKQRVLWKFEDPELSGKPDNVLIKKWFPQSDVLAHPNVKLFITHAGLLSTIESIYHAKPIVGLPIFFDQFQNLRRAKQMGFGDGVKYVDLTEESLRRVVSKVLNNESYLEAARKISKRYRDQPIKPLDLAIYWTEYVLRHNGAPHMRVAALELSLWEYFSIDVISFILSVLIFSLIVIVLLLRVVIKITVQQWTYLNRVSKIKVE